MCVVTRNGNVETIHGTPVSTNKYPKGSDYTTGYVRVTFSDVYRHIIAIGTVPFNVSIV